MDGYFRGCRLCFAFTQFLMMGDVMSHFPDVGYTPDNLRHLLGELNLTQREVAEKLGVQLRAVQRWAAAVDLPTHADMPLKKWNELLNFLNK